MSRLLNKLRKGNDRTAAPMHASMTDQSQQPDSRFASQPNNKPPPTLDVDAEHPRVRLDLSLVDGNATEELQRAQVELTCAVEELEGVLQDGAGPSSKGWPLRHTEINNATASSPPPSFMSTIHAAQHDIKLKDQQLSAGIGRFLVALYPSLKLTLGIAGEATGYAGFQPVQIAA